MNHRYSGFAASKSKWRVTVLALSMLLASLGVSIATVTLPVIAVDFSAPVTDVQWVILAYLLGTTTAIVSAGRMGDLFGSRPVLLAGLALFTAASAACFFADDLGLLIAARLFQGIGGAILMALPISMVRETVPKERTGSIKGLLGTTSAVGTALGPALGGLLVDLSGWQSPYLLLCSAGAVAAALSLRCLPEGQPAARVAAHHLDLPGTFLLAGLLGAFSLALTGLEERGFAATGILLLPAVGGAGAFVAVEARSASPVVDLALLRHGATLGPLLTNMLVSAGMMTTLVVAPFYLALVLDLSETLVGLVLSVGPATAAIAGIPAGRLTDRFGAGRMLIIGLVQTIIGFTCLAFLPDIIGVMGFVLSLMVLTPGFQMFLAANNTAIMLTAPQERRGTISGMLGLSRNLGFMAGAAGMGALFATLSGTGDVGRIVPDAVASAFTVTFLTTAGLVAIALAATLLDVSRRTDRAVQPTAGRG